MKTIYTSLPFYDKVQKQCFERGKKGGVDKPVPIKCPLHRLPSFLINAEADAPGEITGINLVDIAGVETDIMTYFNTTPSYIQTAPGGGWNDPGGTFNTFTSVGTAITRALKTTAAGEDYCYNVVAVGSVPAGITTGDKLRIVVTLTMAGGDEPKIELRNTGTGAAISNTVQLVAGVNYVMLVSTATLAGAWAITLYNSDTETCDWSATFTGGQKTVLPHLMTALTDDYFQYAGETLGTLLTEGIYYLKIETEEDFIYYSDWFHATCVYENLITGWTNVTYETFTSSGTEITSAIETGAAGRANSETFILANGESVRIVFFHTQNSGDEPLVRLYDTINAAYIDSEDAVVGLNDITLTAVVNSTYHIRFYNNSASNYSTSEIFVIREYSETYLTINYTNACDLGDILYSEGLEQTIWFESETMEKSYPMEEKGQVNGYNKFVRSFARQDKKYLVRTLEMPDFMVEVFHRLKLHDTVEMIDLVGDENTIHNLEVEHEWLWDDKYYAKVELTFDYDEAWVVAGCCNDFT